MKLKFKLLIILFSFVINANAIDVLIVKKSISYKEKITTKKLVLKKLSKLKKQCNPVTLGHLNSKTFIAAHYINKNSILCKKNIKEYKKNSVLFNFGSIEIEKNGKVINENKKYIIIKNENGKREKIYKDGRLK